MDDLLKAAEILLTNYFQGTGLSGKTFAILFKVRNNNTLTRQSVISELASLIHQFNSANKADLTSPELAVLVEVICNCCCLSVVPDYFLLKKYNVAELTSHTPSEVKTASSEPVCKNESSQQDASEKIKTEEPKLTDKNTITQQVATVDEDAKAQKPIIASENTTIQEQDT